MENIKMNGRLLPNKDFQKVMQHDKVYCQALTEKLEFHTIKEDILNKKCSMILATQTKEAIIKNIDLLCEWSETKITCLDTKGKLMSQLRLVEDKERHYDKVFLPQYKKEIAECNKHFESMIKDCRQFVIDKPKMSEEILPKIETELFWFDSLTKEEQKEEEYKLQVFKPIRRLFNAYNNLVKDAK
jgi:hypothetical protein